MVERKTKEEFKPPSDAIDSYFECITACSLDAGGVECLTECVEVHLKTERSQ
tara:strand:- start:2771 stop:2926 length:156 start_codon:yes stop_codon:yes gene_type:complete